MKHQFSHAFLSSTNSRCYTEWLLLGLFVLLSMGDLAFAQTCSNPVQYNDPASQDGVLETMNIPCAWTLTNGDPGIAVAVVDRYLDDAHDELAGKVILPINGNCDPSQANEHHGIQSFGAIAGIRNNAVCIAGSGGDTKVAGWCGYANNTNLQQILDAGYKIVSISAWSGISRATMEKLTENGVVVLVAGLDQYHQAYEDVPGVVHVGRAWMNGDFWQYGSPTNQNLDVLVTTESLDRIVDGNDCEPAGGGTSIGTPLLAGVVALMRAVNPCLSPADIEEILVQTAAPIPANATPDITRAGVFDAYQAVLAAQNFVGVDQTWGAGGGGATIENAYVSGNLDIFTGGDVIVNGNVYFGNESIVTVQPNARLTVNGGLFLGGNSQIIVQRGGQLVVDGGTLTKSFCADSWRGIIVEGNATYPQQLPSPQTYANLNGIVHLTNGAIIEHAGIAVSMSPSHIPWPNSDYYGGLVVADNATFRNNDRAVEFMKYRKFEDQSSFTNVAFEGNGKFITTHWENHGVKFDNCQFSNYQHQAILTWDASVIVVNGCTFDNAGHTQYDQASIHLYHTSSNPYASIIGDHLGAPNVFSGGYYAVYSTSAANMEPTLVTNNIFIGGNTAVTMDGVSNQSIENNDHIGQVFGNRIIGNGPYANETLDNHYSDTEVGVFSWYDNSNYQFSANCFDLTVRKDFRLDEGLIEEDQGSPALAASNCFSSGFAKGIRLTGGSTVFRYHILQGTPTSSCQRPAYSGNVLNSVSEQALECGSTATVGPINIDRIQCAIATDPDDIEADILNLLLQLSQLESDLSMETYLSVQWLQIKYQITEVERCIQQMKLRLIQIRGKNDELSDLRDFFASDDFYYRTYVYGMYVHNEKYDSARAYLNGLSPIGEEQVDFVFVQSINLDRLEDRNYVLAAADSAQLYAIGKKVYPLNGFARSLYYVLTGEKLVLDLPEEEELAPRQATTVETSDPLISVYPNPANDHFVVTSSNVLERNLLISISDVQGRVLDRKTMLRGSLEMRFDMSHLMPGVFIINAYDAETEVPKFHSKLVKQ
ncbi:MAG: T9SS type A sorting domain-containing protein [Saprospiraceae bacterium]|nr:T9SS type A sorting domain-containing protein [Saprospiraceae bacterium]